MQTQTTATAIDTKAKRKYSGMPRSRRIMQNLTFWIPVVIFALLITCAIFAHFIAPYPFDKMDMVNRWAPPGTP
ncbi:MAG: hypothetical protein ABR886_06015, partial [Dehalococcoidales bacterium]